MSKERSWRDISRRVIRETLAVLPPGASLEDRRKTLRKNYPFGQREYTPYKVWCQEVRKALGPRQRKPAAYCLCSWCENRPGGCLQCGFKWQQIRQVAADPGARGLIEEVQRRVGAGLLEYEAAGRLADWLEERGFTLWAECLRGHEDEPGKCRWLFYAAAQIRYDEGEKDDGT